MWTVPLVVAVLAWAWERNRRLQFERKAEELATKLEEADYQAHLTEEHTNAAHDRDESILEWQVEEARWNAGRYRAVGSAWRATAVEAGASEDDLHRARDEAFETYEASNPKPPMPPALRDAHDEETP